MEAISPESPAESCVRVKKGIHRFRRFAKRLAMRDSFKPWKSAQPVDECVLSGFRGSRLLDVRRGYSFDRVLQTSSHSKTFASLRLCVIIRRRPYSCDIKDVNESHKAFLGAATLCLVKELESPRVHAFAPKLEFLGRRKGAKERDGRGVAAGGCGFLRDGDGSRFAPFLFPCFRFGGLWLTPHR